MSKKGNVVVVVIVVVVVVVILRYLGLCREARSIVAHDEIDLGQVYVSERKESKACRAKTFRKSYYLGKEDHIAKKTARLTI